jgi:type III restriction enzyme
VLIALHGTNPEQVGSLKDSLANPDLYFHSPGRNNPNLQVLINQALKYLSLHSREFDKFKILEDEINHFRHIRVSLEEVDFSLFETKLLQSLEKPRKLEELKAQFNARQLSLDELVDRTSDLGGSDSFTHLGQTVEFKHIQQHYYLPMLVSHDEKLDYIRSVIKVRSEVDFITRLETYLKEGENLFKQFDWWLFSRLDENSDNVNVPYYDPVSNKISNFKPDFIFWLQKGNDYHIIFVDPKGTGRTEYEHKVDGFRKLFEENGNPKVFNHDGLNVRVHLFLFTEDRAWVAEYYRKYWLDSISNMIVL